MNACAHCGREYNSSKPRCEKCPSGLVAQEQNVNTEQEHQVIEPEVVRPHGGQYEQSHSEWSQGGATFKTWTFNQNGSGFRASANDSCLPGLITLGIALSLGVQFGLLASIGFFVFYAVGSAISFFVNMRRMVEGRPMSPWIGRIIVWLVCIFITASLAG